MSLYSLSHYFILATGGLLVLGMTQGQHSFRDYFELQESRQVLVQTVNALKSDIEGLETEIVRIKSSKSYALKVLRDKYHVLKEGEEIIFITD